MGWGLEISTTTPTLTLPMYFLTIIALVELTHENNNQVFGQLQLGISGGPNKDFLILN